MNAYTIEEVAQQWGGIKPAWIRALIADGSLKARRDGKISERVLIAYIRRRQRVTQIYLAKRRAA